MTEEVKKKGDPTALGIFAYGFSLFALSMYATGFFSFSTESIVMIAPALFFGGLFLLIASIWEYNNGNTFGATAFATYSGFFLVFAFAHIGIKLGWFAPLIVAHLVGIMAFAFIIMTFIYWIGSFKMNLVLNLTLFFLLIVFILYAIPLLTLTASNTTAFGTFPATALAPAGWVGILDSILTMWIGAAVIINDRWEVAGSHGPIPLFPFGKKGEKTASKTPAGQHH
ncbi:MAG: acetate uptake transporter [Candidatus Thermoplasmatota archaeon]|nr:acetate uptake transporter [Candidatus Thermoplasmatota archaeon]